MTRSAFPPMGCLTESHWGFPRSEMRLECLLMAMRRATRLEMHLATLLAKQMDFRKVIRLGWLTAFPHLGSPMGYRMDCRLGFRLVTHLESPLMDYLTATHLGCRLGFRSDYRSVSPPMGSHLGCLTDFQKVSRTGRHLAIRSETQRETQTECLLKGCHLVRLTVFPLMAIHLAIQTEN